MHKHFRFRSVRIGPKHFTKKRIKKDDSTFPEYSVVLGNYVNVRAKPSLKGKVLTQLKLLNLVEVLEKHCETITINGKKGSWVYVNTFKGTEEAESSDYIDSLCVVANLG